MDIFDNSPHARKPSVMALRIRQLVRCFGSWIYEKFQAWTDNKGLPEDALSMDQMLDNISIYWFTNSAASSARIYWEKGTRA